MKNYVLFLFILSAIVLPSPGKDLLAQDTFVVNSTADGGDNNIGDNVCNTTAGGCTLRAAIEEANDDPDRDTIHFSFPGAVTIMPDSPLPDIIEGIFIDGVSFDNASCPTQSNPANLLITLSGGDFSTPSDLIKLRSGADFSIIRGLNLTEARDGIDIRGAAPDFLQGVEIVCNHIGTNNNSNAGLGNEIGIDVDSQVTLLTIGGDNYSDRNVISGSRMTSAIRGYGIFSKARSMTVKGNYIGTGVDGVSELGNEKQGIHTNQQYSGQYLISENTIAYSGDDGIDAVLSGLNSSDGIEIIGNTIHNNGEYGIDFTASAPDAIRLVSQNNMWDNGDLGIDTSNNPIRPTLLSYDSNTQTLSSNTPSGTQEVEVFHSDSCDPSGYGEGMEYIESFIASGSSQILSVPLPSDKYLTITVTRNNKTSKFSNCITRYSFLVNTNSDTPDSNQGDGICADSNGECSLRAAIQETNLGPVGETRSFYFDLPNRLILISNLLGVLPPIQRPVVIDATSLSPETCPANETDAPDPWLIIEASQGHGGGDGLLLGAGSSGSIIQGLRIDGFPGNGIQVDTGANELACLSIGTAIGNGENGIELNGNANDIGGPEDWQRVVTMNSTEAGIEISGNSNNVWNSFIGNDGSSPAPNNIGVVLLGTATTNSIGSYTDADSGMELAPNVISGNTSHGVHSQGSGALNYFGGNLVGFRADGSIALGNGGVGIFVESPLAVVGQSRGENNLLYDTPNVVGFNGGSGIALWDDDGYAFGNYVGVKKNSSQANNQQRGFKHQWR